MMGGQGVPISDRHEQTVVAVFQPLGSRVSDRLPPMTGGCRSRTSQIEALKTATANIEHIGDGGLSAPMHSHAGEAMNGA